VRRKCAAGGLCASAQLQRDHVSVRGTISASESHLLGGVKEPRPSFASEDSSLLYYGLLAGKLTNAGLLAAGASVLQTLAFIRFAA